MIRLENGWVIVVDGTVYILKKFIKWTTNKKTGEQEAVWSNALYYGSLKQAIQGWIRVSTAECLSTKNLSLHDALKCVTEHLERIESMLDEILGEKSSKR